MYLLKVLIKTDYNWQSNIFLDLNILQGQGVGKTSLSAALNLILLNNTDWGHFSQTNELFHFKYFTYLFHFFVFVASNIMESNYWGPLFQFTLANVTTLLMADKPEICSHFFSPRNPSRKTCAEIVREARQSLRVQSTRRPFTPRDAHRQLFGTSSVRVDHVNRPPSSFRLVTQPRIILLH